MAIATLGTLSYGTVVFTALERSKFNTVPRWDDAQRNIVSWRHGLEVEGWIGGSNTDATMQTYHNTLCTPGLKLLYNGGRGYGGPDGTGLHVNDGTVWDVSYGPKPAILSYIPLGAGNAAKVVWQCTTEIPNCSGAVFKGQPLAVNYSWATTIDMHGLTNLSISGYIEIPATRQPPSRTIPDVADFYRERVLGQIPVPLSFRRMNQVARTSPDKRRLDFSWTDQELPYPLPVGCTYAEAMHRVRWNFRTSAMFSCNLSGTITLAPDIPPQKALEKWQSIVAARVNIANQPGALGGGGVAGVGADPGFVGPPVPAGGKAFCALDDIEIGEEVFGRTTHFSTTYRIIGTTLKNLLGASGLFNKIKDADSFDKWSQSMNNSAHNIRGWAGLKLGTSQDTINDLCPGGTLPILLQPPRVKAATKKAGLQGEAAQLAIGQPAAAPPIVPDVGAPIINPENSWIEYKSWYAFLEDSRIVEHIPLNTAKTTQERPITPGQKVGASLGGSKSLNEATGMSHNQRLSKPQWQLRMWGKAMRLGLRVPSFEGPGNIFGASAAPAGPGSSVGRVGSPNSANVLHGDQVETTQGSIGGVPVYVRVWDYTYTLPTQPKRLPIGANPAMQLPPS